MPLSPRSLKRNQSLQEQAYQALKTAILSGELAPGQRLIEVQLAKQLQVSRTPIREAMQLLEHENLIVNDANDTLRVATISVTDAAQLYRLPDCPRATISGGSLPERHQIAIKRTRTDGRTSRKVSR